MRRRDGKCDVDVDEFAEQRATLTGVNGNDFSPAAIVRAQIAVNPNVLLYIV